MIIIFILFLLILFIFYNYDTFYNNDTFYNYDTFYNNNINNYYLTKEELSNILISNDDNYYETFNDYDYKVRNINNIIDYYKIINNSCSTIDYNKSKILDKIINNINNKLINFKITGFDGEKASKIPWIIGFLNDTGYENGFPHTRNNIIIIPVHLFNNKSSLQKILIHEKIHIYQKMYPDDIQLYLNEHGFTRYCLRQNYNDCRANPDLDKWLYKDSNGNIMKSKYINNPKSINDVIFEPINNDTCEHPLEYMAYSLADII
jgi:predicted RND superfamily exporter protein